MNLIKVPSLHARMVLCSVEVLVGKLWLHNLVNLNIVQIWSYWPAGPESCPGKRRHGSGCR